MQSMDTKLKALQWQKLLWLTYMKLLCVASHTYFFQGSHEKNMSFWCTNELWKIPTLCKATYIIKKNNCKLLNLFTDALCVKFLWLLVIIVDFEEFIHSVSNVQGLYNGFSKMVEYDYNEMKWLTNESRNHLSCGMCKTQLPIVTRGFKSYDSIWICYFG